MAGPFDFLHIKGRTAGTSNELSFDVLDAARSGIDPQKKRSAKSPTGPKPSQGTYHGVAGTSTLSAVPEVERRKRARRAHSLRLWFLAIVAIAALVGTAAFFGYRFYQERVDFNGHFNNMVDRFIEIDQVLVAADDLMVDPLDAAALEQQARITDQLPQLTRELNALDAESQDMDSTSRSDDDRAALSSVQLAAEARKDMIAAATEAFELAQQAGQLADATESEWAKLMEGDSLARSAAEAANSASTEEATRSARDQTTSAIELMREAREGLERIDQQARDAGLSAEETYIDKRIEALESAVETADALLDGDREAAASANNAYNAADREAAVLAYNLPLSPAIQVRTSFQPAMDEIIQSYDESRSAAATADSSIRSYL